jgi:hypothetical protein
VRRIALMGLITGLVAVTSASGASNRTTTFGMYARPTQVQYMNHSDDRARGDVDNPFNTDSKALVPLTQKKEAGKGPYPGDNALFSFKLYKDAALTKSIGSAVYSCTFNFDHEALCEASFQLVGGTMSGSGPADFTNPEFTLAVDGGTGKYLDARGQVSSSPASKNAHHLEFMLAGT